MKASLRILISGLVYFLLAGCATQVLDTSSFTQLDDFDSVEKSCSSDSQCKTLKVDYLSCGHYEYMVYSTKAISGTAESDLKKIAEKNIVSGKKIEKESMSEICLAVSQTPFQGVCWKNGCEMIQTWR